jgi:hypothetical protein
MRSRFLAQPQRDFVMQRDDWAVAYYHQAYSDWTIFREFSGRSDVPRAQALHYLQMATEKLAKAYRLRDTNTDLETLLTSHVGFPAFLNVYMRSPKILDEYAGKFAKWKAVNRYCQALARHVEMLAPAVNREVYPENAEYPWEAGERIIVPIFYDFPNLSFLQQPQGRNFLNLIERAFRDFWLP